MRSILCLLVTLMFVFAVSMTVSATNKECIGVKLDLSRVAPQCEHTPSMVQMTVPFVNGDGNWTYNGAAPVDYWYIERIEGYYYGFFLNHLECTYSPIVATSPMDILAQIKAWHRGEEPKFAYGDEIDYNVDWFLGSYDEQKKQCEDTWHWGCVGILISFDL